MTQNSVRQAQDCLARNLGASIQERQHFMNDSSRRQYAESLSLRSGNHFRPWPITAGKLVSLIDLGWSDNRIACHFDVEPVKVSALRVYYGLVVHAQDSWLWRMRRRKRLESEG